MNECHVRKVRLLPPSPANPRNSEGAFLPLSDGRLFFAYSHFYGGAHDNSTARIAGRFSYDRGETWTEDDVLVVDTEGSENVMSVSLLRLHSVAIALFYLLKNSWGDCKLYMRISEDEAQTWGDKRCAIPHEGYHVINNDRVVQLSSGRWVVPTAYHPCPDSTWESWSHRGISACALSDDEGRTWRMSRSWLEGPSESKTGLQEPGVVELTDGRLMMWMRTDMGCPYRSYSDDGGDTWSPAVPTDLRSPTSPASIKRIPATGDLLLVWNDHRHIGPGFSEKRTPLTTALSRDEGKTWEHVKVLEDDPEGCFCYTAIAFVDEKAVLGYCAGNPRIGLLNLLQITVVDVAWLYES
ncbi:MAG: sialidase family protein [Candidatus Latescibacterota bacterium]